MHHESTERAADGWVQCGGDPLLWFLTVKLELSTPWMILAVVLLSAGVTFGVGSLVSYVAYPDVPMIRVLDSEHLYYALVVHLMFVPIIWLIYVWQHKGISDALESLRKQNVILDDEQDEFGGLCDRMRRSVNRWYLPVVAVLVVSVLVTLQIRVVFPRTTAVVGKPSFWSYDTRYYALNTAMWFLIYYVTAMVGVKGVLTLGWFGYLFRKLRVKVDPFHPDGAGGMGALGSLAANYAAIGIGIGVMAAAYSLARVAAGAGWVYLDAIVLYVLYLLVTPVSLLLPIWSAHDRMLEARSELLSKLSTEIDMTLRKVLRPSTEETPRGWSMEVFGFEVQLRRRGDVRDREGSDADKQLEKLHARYKFIKESYPTWPIPLTFARNLSVVAMLPLITGILGLIAKL